MGIIFSKKLKTFMGIKNQIYVMEFILFFLHMIDFIRLNREKHTQRPKPAKILSFRSHKPTWSLYFKVKKLFFCEFTKWIVLSDITRHYIHFLTFERQ